MGVSIETRKAAHVRRVVKLPRSELNYSDTENPR